MIMSERATFALAERLRSVEGAPLNLIGAPSIVTSTNRYCGLGPINPEMLGTCLLLAGATAPLIAMPNFCQV